MWGRFALLDQPPLEVKQLLELHSVWNETPDLSWSGLLGVGVCGSILGK